MPDERHLREQARAAMRTGKIPARRQDRTWGGPGVGAPCVICGVPVGKQEMEIQLEFTRDGAVPDLDKYHLHPRCYAAWEFEWKKVSEAPH